MSISNQRKKTYYPCREDVYKDVLKLYSEELEIAHQYPLTVEFEKELALDAGGVSRDAFSAFYDQGHTCKCVNYFQGLVVLTLP